MKKSNGIMHMNFKYGFIAYNVYNRDELLVNEDVKLYLHVISKATPDNYSGKIIEIEEIMVHEDKRRQGYMRPMINSLYEEFPEDIICLLASPTKDEYLIAPTDKEYEEFFEKMEDIYTDMGFANINKYNICYENSIPFISTTSEIGHEVYCNIVSGFAYELYDDILIKELRQRMHL